MARTAEMEGLLEVDEVAPLEPSAPNGDQQPTVQNDEVAELRRQLKEERQARKEESQARSQFQKTAEFWAQRASAPTAAKPVAEAEPETPAPTVDLVDALTNGDHKAVAKALREMGFVDQREVNKTIHLTRQQITKEAKLLSDYPFLQQERSAEFRRTGEIWNELNADPDFAGNPRLVEIAARLAKAEMGGGPVRQQRLASDDFVEDADPEETDRQMRVSRQAGDRGRSQSRHDGADEGDELSATQLSIVQKFRAAGVDIDEEKYRKRAKSGIRMGGLPTFRRGGRK